MDALQLDAAEDLIAEFLARSSADHESSSVPIKAQGPSKWMQDFKRRRIGDATDSADVAAGTSVVEPHPWSPEGSRIGIARDAAPIIQASSLQQQVHGQSRRTREAAPKLKASSSFSDKRLTGSSPGLASRKGKCSASMKGRRGALDGFLTKHEKAMIAAAAATAGRSSRKENVAGSTKAGYSETDLESCAQGRQANGIKETKLRRNPGDLRAGKASFVPAAFTPRTEQEISATRATGRAAPPVTKAGGKGSKGEAERRLLGLQRFRDVVLKESREVFVLRSELVGSMACPMQRDLSFQGATEVACQGGPEIVSGPLASCFLFAHWRLLCADSVSLNE